MCLPRTLTEIEKYLHGCVSWALGLGLNRSSTQAADVNKTTNRPLNHSAEEWGGGKTNPTKSRLIRIDPSVSISKENIEDKADQFV